MAACFQIAAAVWIMLQVICGPASGQDLDHSLDQLNNRMVRLSRRLDDILEERDAATFAVRRLTRTLDDSEGIRGACKQGFFPCGHGPVGAVPCVRDYLVCDGSNDCKNGADESSVMCSNMPFDRPMTIPSVVIRDRCRRAGQSMLQKLYIVYDWTLDPANIISWFPSRPQITWTYSFRPIEKLDSVVLLYGSGYYDYVTGDVIMHFETNQAKYGPCKFDQVSRNKVLYRCHYDNSPVVIDSGQETCILAIAIMSGDSILLSMDLTYYSRLTKL